MTATYVLTTDDESLARAWERQLLTPAIVTASREALKREVQREGARVWIRDMAAAGADFTPHRDTVVVIVGEPMSLPFEDAKRESTFSLSYEESRTELRRLAPVLGELAEMRAVSAMLQEPAPRSEAETADPHPAAEARRSDELASFEAAIENIKDLGRMIEEFRRAARNRLRAFRVSVFLREGDEYAAVPEHWRCPANHRFVSWLHNHSAIVEPATVDRVHEPASKVAVRQKLAEWNARLIVPIDVQGAITGWLACGPRADGRPYTSDDRDDAMMLGRLLARLLEQNEAWRLASTGAEEARLVRQYGPQFRVVEGTAAGREAMPVEAREIASLARRESKRIEREFGRLRVVAGPVPGTSKCWVWWDESELTEASLAAKREVERYENLHDIGIMLSHELANALFSVSTFVQHAQQRPPETEEERRWWPTVAKDLDRVKQMPHLLSTLHEMANGPTSRVDMRKLLAAVAKEINGTVPSELGPFATEACSAPDVPEDPVIIWGHEEPLKKAFVWLCREILDTREKTDGSRETPLSISLRTRGDGDEAICLVNITCSGLRMEQIHAGEAKNVGELPTVPIFLAREVVRFHRGIIQVGQGIDHPELMISMRSRRIGNPTAVRSEADSFEPESGLEGRLAAEGESFPASA